MSQATVESLKLTLTDQQLRVDMGGETRFLARAEIGAVFLDGKELVLLDRHSRELLRDTHDAPAQTLAAGFRAHGYPWQERDPYAGRYQRWLPELPELPPRVHALIATRKVALERKERKDAAPAPGCRVRRSPPLLKDVGVAPRRDLMIVIQGR